MVAASQRYVIEIFEMLQLFLLGLCKLKTFIMRVLGIDPGSNVTGYGVLEKDGRKLITLKWGVIRVKRGQSFPEKLKTIYDGLSEVVSLFEPSVAVIENVFFAENAKSALKLGHVRGAAIVAALNSNIEIAEYTPLEIKQSITGYGRADKDQVQSMVKKLLNLTEDKMPLDSSDALAAAICHLHSVNFRKSIKS